MLGPHNTLGERDCYRVRKGKKGKRIRRIRRKRKRENGRKKLVKRKRKIRLAKVNIKGGGRRFVNKET